MARGASAGVLAAALLGSLPAWAGGATFRDSITVAGTKRDFLYYLPARPAAPPPLVFVLHGGGGTAEGMESKLTSRAFDRLAEEDGFIPVYPQGVGRHWNDGRKNDRATVKQDTDELAFFSGLIEFFKSRHGADESRVFATGISNGAFMSFALACGLAGKVRAIAPVAGSMAAGLPDACRPAAPVAVLMINGTEDRLVHWGGGEVTGPLGWRKHGKAEAVEDVFAFWSGRNACRPERAEKKVIDRDPGDGTKVESTALPCAGETRSVLVKVVGGGHTWPGGRQYLPRFLVGRTSKELDASGLIWRFFKGEPGLDYRQVTQSAGIR